MRLIAGARPAPRDRVREFERLGRELGVLIDRDQDGRLGRRGLVHAQAPRRELRRALV
jgi:hypothetical protein